MFVEEKNIILPLIIFSNILLVTFVTAIGLQLLESKIHYNLYKQELLLHI